jgi:hypothetical protein
LAYSLSTGFPPTKHTPSSQHYVSLSSNPKPLFSKSPAAAEQ